MAFNLTRYIFPIESKIKLSDALNLELDNPRTDEEISFISNIIIKSLQINNSNSDEIENQVILRAALGIGELKEYLEINNKDSYEYNFYESLKTEQTIQIIAKSWIILRFTDNNFVNENKQDYIKLFDKLHNGNDNEYLSNFNISLNYSYILSLLINNEKEYHGFSFLLYNNPTEIFYPTDKYKIYRTIENFKDNNNLINNFKNRAVSWIYWYDIKDTIIKTSQNLDCILSLTEKDKPIKNKKLNISKKESAQEKLLYIGSILRTVDHETKNLKLKLVLLTSIIEYLVTKNPDNSRFNVEDSISKQFKLKSAILIYQNIQDVGLDNIKEALEKIYSQRSDIAHGNYNTKNDNSDYLDSVFKLYEYIRAIIQAYLKDKKFVDYLKDN